MMGCALRYPKQPLIISCDAAKRSSKSFGPSSAIVFGASTRSSVSPASIASSRWKSGSDNRGASFLRRYATVLDNQSGPAFSRSTVYIFGTVESFFHIIINCVLPPHMDVCICLQQVSIPSKFSTEAPRNSIRTP